MKKVWKWLKRNLILSLILISFAVWIVVTAWFTMAAISFMVGLAFWQSVSPRIKARTGMAIAIVTTLITALEQFQQRLPETIIDEVVKNEAAVVALNTDDQLYDKGITATGADVKPGYTSYTKKLKGFNGQRIDHVTLRDVGDFHAGFALERVDPDAVEIISTDWKSAKLRAKYGIEIMGLTPYNLDVVASTIYPGLVIEFQNAINKALT